jgi:membrane protease subunit (stomatin/prohibitin family)
VDISIRCHGEYAYRIVDPILFYQNVCGNIEFEYRRDQIDSQLKSELLTALQPAFAKISDMGIRYSSLPGHTTELAKALNEVLSYQWGSRYGIEISTVGVNSVKASQEDEKMIKELQRNAAFKNPTMAAAQLVGAQSAAMQAAASNQSAGAAMAFAGMNMAANAGGMNAQSLFAMGQQAQQQQPQQQSQPQQTAGSSSAGGALNGWTCECGAAGNTGKFCFECGKPKPAADFWTCTCGAKNKGKFCSECGAKKPKGIPQYRCDKCGWEPNDPTKPPKFCPECGDPFDDGDIV